MTPYILLVRKKLPPEGRPAPEHVYDEDRQLWVDKYTGVPMVTSMGTQTEGTQFGETVMSRSREGVDQTEGVALQASRFGETTITETREGVDQTESATLQDIDAPHSHF